jgi:hypothetical protein
VLWSAYLGFLRPEIKRDPALVNLGNFDAELGGVLSRYSILSYGGGIFGVVQGSTPADLIHNAAICAEGCLPNESLLDAVIRHQPAAAFVCTGRIDHAPLPDFAQQLDIICRSLLENSIVPVIINPPLVLRRGGQMLPDTRHWYADPAYWEANVRPLLERDQAEFLPRVVWMSYYADAMAIPNLCPAQLLLLLDDFGFAADEIYRHFSARHDPADYATVLRDLSLPLREWSGSEAMMYLVLRFLKDFDDLPV